MVQPLHPVHYSFAEYVAFERTSNVKHEYLDGRIYAMAGGSPEHAALAAAVNGLLFGQLKVGPCRVYSSDLRVRAGVLTTYPDVTVVCGQVERDPQDTNTALNPTLVVEVTSPSTEVYDRGEKLEHFKQVPSLQSILIVSQSDRLVEHWQRRNSGWELTTARPGGCLDLPSVDATLAVDEIYGSAS
jgi:Uma2 family endonuclease